MRSKSDVLITKIIYYINDCYFTRQEIPSVQEIADAVGITKGTVSKYFTEMEHRGLIERDGTHFGLRTLKMKKAMQGLQMLPVVGEIACGSPILAEQNIESYLSVSGAFLGTGEHFILLAKGTSMINAGIEDGDYIVVRRQSTANDGQIVVAMVEDGECTLKRYFFDSKRRRIRLHPENDEMEDMYYKEISIQGIAVKIIKNIEAIR